MNVFYVMTMNDGEIDSDKIVGSPILDVMRRIFANLTNEKTVEGMRS